ncbi:MAG: inosine monophosphate cyclohydrolase [Ruminococcaceae bacterium]|nr:inosine monophosphate cyclohydrolase [Oscillospiraceae bacterium]
MDKMSDVEYIIGTNSYPGRGIVLGSAPGGSIAIAYFITGRSENSKNRVFEYEDAVMKAVPIDYKKVTDASLILYNALRTVGNKIIVTNGDHTDTIYEHIVNGGRFEDALRTRKYEPDFPTLTPRIAGIINTENADYKLAILKAGNCEQPVCERFFFEYTSVAGLGHYICTYSGDGKPIPSFAGEPLKINIPDDIEEFSDRIWDSLSHKKRVCLFVKYIDFKTGREEHILTNERCE